MYYRATASFSTMFKVCTHVGTYTDLRENMYERGLTSRTILLRSSVPPSIPPFSFSLSRSFPLSFPTSRSSTLLSPFLSLPPPVTVSHFVYNSHCPSLCLQLALPLRRSLSTRSFSTILHWYNDLENHCSGRTNGAISCNEIIYWNNVKLQLRAFCAGVWKFQESRRSDAPKRLTGLLYRALTVNEINGNKRYDVSYSLPSDPLLYFFFLLFNPKQQNSHEPIPLNDRNYFHRRNWPREILSDGGTR